MYCSKGVFNFDRSGCARSRVKRTLDSVHDAWQRCSLALDRAAAMREAALRDPGERPASFRAVPRSGSHRQLCSW